MVKIDFSQVVTAVKTPKPVALTANREVIHR